MGITKTELFTPAQNKLASFAKALGHPARIAILDVLIHNDNCICNDIVEQVPLAQATISQHLKELKDAGIIKGSIQGNSICYCIDTDSFKDMMNFLEGIKNIQTNCNC
jgi:ArsR family transcriptional regulator, arsenate/arsenite/antimonite-responsive transcriptional repressor